MSALPIHAAVLIVVVLAGCYQLDRAPLTGVVHTDRQGEILEDDPSDWQPRCGEAGGFCITPLSPNPIQIDGSAQLTFVLPEDVFVSARVEDEHGNVFDEITGDRLDAGETTLAVGAPASRGYRKGIYRIVLTAHDAKGGLLFRSFGDLGVKAFKDDGSQLPRGAAPLTIISGSE